LNFTNGAPGTCFVRDMAEAGLEKRSRNSPSLEWARSVLSIQAWLNFLQRFWSLGHEIARLFSIPHASIAALSAANAADQFARWQNPAHQ